MLWLSFHPNPFTCTVFRHSFVTFLSNLPEFQLTVPRAQKKNTTSSSQKLGGNHFANYEQYFAPSCCPTAQSDQQSPKKLLPAAASGWGMGKYCLGDSKGQHRTAAIAGPNLIQAKLYSQYHWISQDCTNSTVPQFFTSKCYEIFPSHCYFPSIDYSESFQL